MFWIFLFFFITPISAQNAPTNMQVGVNAQVSKLEFGKPFSVSYVLPQQIISIISVDTNVVDPITTRIGGLSIEGTSFTIEAAYFSASSYEFPSFLVTALDTQNNTNLFYTPGFTVPVSNAIDTTNIQFADIIDPPFVWNHIWTIAIAALLAIIAIIILLSMRKRVVAPKKVDPIEPFRQLQQRLSLLESQKSSLTEETYKIFYVELSEVIRGLLTLEVMPLALESSTRDILDTLKKRRIPSSQREHAALVLRTCDAAKYAKAVFPQEHTDRVFQSASELFRIIPHTHEPSQERTK
ncbi:MAG: hypothetical protein ACRC9L_02190 [Brevinema sp.]